jgi:hypothetical protein
VEVGTGSKPSSDDFGQVIPAFATPNDCSAGPTGHCADTAEKGAQTEQAQRRCFAFAAAVVIAAIPRALSTLFPNCIFAALRIYPEAEDAW